MQRIILCEGKTDAILASYMLGKLHRWTFNNSLTQSRKAHLPVEHDNETLNWYSRGQENLVIWGVGGYTELGAKIKKIGERTQAEADPNLRFSRIVVIMDHNSRTDQACASDAEAWFVKAGFVLDRPLQLSKWLHAKVTLDRKPPADHRVRILVLAVPPDSPGALETFLLQALRGSSEEDRHIVDQAEAFIGRIPDKPYLLKRRLRSKASLGSVLSVMSPDWVFSRLDERIQRVKWEELVQVHRFWQLLDEL